MMNPVVERVWARVVRRSAGTRRVYLERVARARGGAVAVVVREFGSCLCGLCAGGEGGFVGG